MYSVRAATVSDISELARMRWDFRLEEGESPDKSWEEFLKEFTDFIAVGFESKTWYTWAAEFQGSPVAFASVQVIQKLPKAIRCKSKIGYLTSVYTRPDHRSRGVGLKLLEEVRNWSQNCDLEILIVWPSDRSQSLYSRAGFQKSKALELDV